MKRLPPSLVALAAAAAIASGQALAAVDSRASRYYEDALTRYEKQDIPGAIIQLKNALQIDKSMLPVQVLLGKALLQNGDAIGAEVAFREALRLGVSRAEVVVPLTRAALAQGKQRQIVEEPLYSPAGLPPGLQAQQLLLRASASADLGDSRAAMKGIQASRDLDPRNPASWLAEVPVRIRARQFREANAAVERALALAPGSAEALYLRGSIAHVQGDIDAALTSYGQALKLDPTHTEALVSRAGLLMDQGRVADASRDVTELLRSSPNDPRGFYLQALIADRKDDAVAAKTSLHKITGLLDPVPMDFLRYRPQALMLGGLAHYGLNEREKARPYLEAVQITQPNTGAAKLLAQIYLGEGNTDRAIEALDGYLRAQPNDSQAQMLLASVQMSKGRYARATQLMQDALKVQDSPAMRTMLGVSLVGSGKFGDAVAELDAAFKTDPSQVQAGTALTSLYIQSRQGAKAVRVAQRLVKQQPGSAGLQNLLGMARAMDADKPGARAAFEAAAKLDGSFLPPQINLARLDIADRSYDRAAARLGAVLARDDKNVDALEELGRLSEVRGQLADAQRWLQKADDNSDATDLRPGLALVDFLLRTNQPVAAQAATARLTNKAPEAVAVLISLARVSFANGDSTAAKISLASAASRAAYNPLVLLQIAYLQVQARHLADAAYTLDKVLSVQADFLPALALMAEVEMRQGALNKAEQRIRNIVASYPKAGVGYGLQGDLALARNQTSSAVNAYRRAQQVQPSTENLLRLHGALRESDPSTALELARQWLKSHPTDRAVLRAVADDQARAGSLASARSTYEALLKLTPDDADALNNLANVLILANDPGALGVAEQALKKNPTVPYIIGTVGWAAFKAGHPDRSLQLLRDALLRDPANPDTRYFLAAVLASTGRASEALPELERALRAGRFEHSDKAERLLRTLK